MAGHCLFQKEREMSAETNKAIVRRYYEEVLNQRNPTIFDELFAPDFKSHSRTSEFDLQAYREAAERSLHAFPDLRVTIESQIAEDDMVATRWSAIGTHQGVFGGVQPTGKTITITAMHFHRLADGRITDHWEQLDLFGLMQQLNVLSQIGKR
jgi:steroid delta-isomerase-like uncharacterized protein